MDQERLVSIRTPRSTPPTSPSSRTPTMKTKERFVFLECTSCKNRNYTTFKRQKAGYKLEKKKYCRFCRKHTSHKEHKL